MKQFFYRVRVKYTRVDNIVCAEFDTEIKFKHFVSYALAREASLIITPIPASCIARMFPSVSWYNCHSEKWPKQ